MCQYLHCPQYFWVSKLAIFRIGRIGLLYGRPPDRILAEAKKTSTELEYFKSITPPRRVPLYFGTTLWYSTPTPHLLCINNFSSLPSTWLAICIAYELRSAYSRLLYVFRTVFTFVSTVFSFVSTVISFIHSIVFTLKVFLQFSIRRRHKISTHYTLHIHPLHHTPLKPNQFK
jgi:hypothetical protein